jgi:hypothetical protein
MPDTPKSQPTYATDYVKGDFDKAVYLDNPHLDNLTTAFLGLGTEFWVMRKRHMVLESYLSEHRLLDPAKFEAYEPSMAQKAVFEKERDDFISRIFSVLTRETQATPTSLPAATVAPRNTP